MSNWDRQWVGDDGSLNATYYITDLAYDVAYAMYNEEPVGNKRDLPAQVVRNGKGYLVMVDGKALANVPITWSRLDGRLNEGPIMGEVNLEWRAYDDPQRFMVKLYIKNA
jgi:hypothetical protein